MSQTYTSRGSVSGPASNIQSPVWGSAHLGVTHMAALRTVVFVDGQNFRKNLQSWLTELSLEDGCLSPARAEELRQWAMTHRLEDEAVRMGRLLRQEGS